MKVTSAAAGPAGPRSVVSASQWERENGQAAVDWMRSSGVAKRMLDDACQAVETLVEWIVGQDSDRAHDTLLEYPRVLRYCDGLDFDEGAQALAYLTLHLPDRFCRMFQVLEQLLISGRLPIGRSDNFAAIDIGAGPGPGMFAIRSFYAALAHYIALNDSSLSVVPLGHSDVVERSGAMPSMMHNYAEALLLSEAGRRVDGSSPAEPNPCFEELQRSSMPFGVRFRDFTVLDVRAEEQRIREARAWTLYEDEYLALTWEEAKRLAYAGWADRPTAYALAVMMNFLTPGSDALALFSEAIDRLMASALVPGGTILVLGACGPDYQEIYRQLDARATAARLKILQGFDQPLQAGHRPVELAAVGALTRRVWHKLEELGGDVSEIKAELKRYKADDIFDESVPFVLPSFRVRAYRRGA
jgi:hypothetical protein